MNTNIIIIILLLIILLIIFYFIIPIFLYKHLIKKKELYEKQIKKQNKNLPINKLNNIPILFINLDRSKDRLKHMLNQIKTYNISNIHRISGIDGNKINYRGDNIGDFVFVNNDFNNNTKSELGCLLSHIKAIKYAYNNNLETVLITEDDISFELMQFWNKSLQQVINNAPTDWQVLQLYNNCNIYDCNNCNKYIDSKKEHCYGAGAYLINKNGQESILKLFNNNLLILDKSKLNSSDLASDHLLPKYLKNWYSYREPLFITKNDKDFLESTIHPSHIYMHIYNNNKILKYYVNNNDIPDLNISFMFNDIKSKNNYNNRKLFNTIDVILYINLEHRKDRKKRFENEIINLDISLENIIRIPGIYTPNNGAIGCLLSHIKALSFILKYYNNSIVLIAEDDVIFKDNINNINNKLSSIFDKLGDNWDVIMLAHNTQQFENTNIPFLIQIKESLTASAYIINPKYIKKLLNNYINDYLILLKTQIWKTEYCVDVSWKKLQKNDKWYAIEPSFVIQGKSYSDIEKREVNYGV
jgi:glycosyl transferase family 25